jgi:hypothetical protein
MFALAAFAFALPARGDATHGLAFAIVKKDGAPVQDDDWVRRQIATANELFAPAHVSFRWWIDKELDPSHVEIHTKGDRDALSALTERTGFIDVFLVARLEDVDEPGRYRKGVVWTHRPDGKRYVVLSAEAPIGVLAHELGHFFGNAHTTVPDNLMSYLRTEGGTVSFDETQIARVDELSRRFLGWGRLFDIGVPRLFP